MKDKLEYLIIAQFLALSGGLFFFVEYSRFTLILWVLSCFLYTRYSRKNSSASRYNFRLWTYITLWILISTFVVNGGDLDSTMFVSYILFGLGSAFYLSCMDFIEFKRKLLLCANWLFGVSIIVHLLHSFSILPATYISWADGSPIAMCLYLFNVEWGTMFTPFGELYRFGSIYWEVGQAQIVLTFVLILFVNDIANNVYTRTGFTHIIHKYSILLLSLLMTGSTTGYLSLAAIIITIFYANKTRVSTVRKILYATVIGSFLLATLFSSSTITEKQEQMDDMDAQSSFSIRLFDNLAALSIACDNPIFGLGCQTKNYRETMSNEGSRTASNGWLSTSAQLGFTYLGVLFLCMYHGIKRMKLKLNTLLLLFILVLSQCNEHYIHFPYLFIYLYKFKSYI